MSDQRPSEQQGYYGWQYDQDATEVRPPSPSGAPPRSFPPLSGKPPQKYPSQAPDPQQTRVPSKYQQHYQERSQQPVQDMGMTLGFGQGTENQFFDVPQPSQPMAQLRQDRLQQLREERMRRQQRRIRGADLTTIFPWKGANSAGADSLPPPSGSLSSGNLGGPYVPRTPGRPPQDSAQGLPSDPTDDQTVVPVRLSSLRPQGLQLPKRLPPTGADLQPAAASAQDTGMLQKVRVGRAMSILTIAFVASRILGILRTSMFAYVFGTSHVSDAYLQAFLIPDLIFNIVSGGALSSAFIPVFTNYMVGERDEKKAWHVASSALNLAVVLMTVLSLTGIIFARQIVPLYNIGVASAQLDLIASLTRIMLLQSVILGGGVIVTSVLNAQQDFKLSAIGSVLYNVGLIAGLCPGIFFALTNRGDANFAVYAATWGVVIGALLQVGVQVPGLMKVGMKYTRTFDWKDPGVIQIAKQMIPRIGNSAMIYLSTFVDRNLILLVVGTAGGGVTQYYQAFQLVLLPFGIFGLSPATAVFPTLAENVAKGRFDRVRNTILETLRSILFTTLPSGIGLIILGLPVIQVLLQHGHYNLDSAQGTYFPLAAFAIGLSGLCAVELLTRSFYAMRDTKTPVIVSVAQFVFKIALSLVVVNAAVWGTKWGLAALAFSTSAANILEAIVLFWLLDQRIGDMQTKELLRFIGRVLLASLAMAIVVFLARELLDRILDTTTGQSTGFLGTIEAIIKLGIEVFVGLFVYVRASRFMGIQELGPIKRILDRLKLSWI
ncbi:murein biosynthesis integral membrane protein MurJ [Dictyobacter vulcani]|uniref:murein biosynthesis integral membrane protein MurJ n=1 Tax=Dictyobacter vulcani TaxID=2607529 RepID=UPI001250A85C|nr:murein biosynthesis integral membrane protein MurJ [Dictyobacter vulcani]